MLLFCTVSVSSCSKEIEPEGNSETAISFSSKVGKTKALVNSIVDMYGYGDNDGFKVYGYYTNDEGNTCNNVFSDEFVKVRSNDGISWTYSPIAYWENDAKYTFLGFYPSDSEIIINSTDLNSNGQLSNPSFTYSLKSEFRNQPDFLFAKEYTDSHADQVDLNFNHLLCQVVINVFTESENQIIKLKKSTLSGFSISGRYTNFSASQLGSWSSFSGYAAYEENHNQTLTNKPYCISKSNNSNAYLMIPRTYDSGIIKLILDCEVSTDDGETYKSVNIQKIFPITEWLPSTIYKYNAEITIDYNIQFSEPTVTPWGTEQTTGSVIIK